MSFSKIHWFGDSWCEGWPGGGTPFANLTSQSLNKEFENHGKSGTGIFAMFNKFLEVKDSIKSDHLVIFCLTTAYRPTWFDDQGREIVLNISDESMEHKIWNTYIANDYFLSYQSHNLLNTLYFMCQTLDIRCLFVNNFFSLKRVNMLTPDSVWLLPPGECLANSVLGLPIKSPEVAIKDRTGFKVSDFSLMKKQLSVYFIPNNDHPNQLGNETIAKFLTKRIPELLELQH